MEATLPRLTRSSSVSVSQIPSSVGQNETNRNILFSQAIEMTQQSISADERGDLQTAFLGYQKAIEMFISLMKTENNQQRKALMKRKAQELLDRAETIKKILKEPNMTGAKPVEEANESSQENKEQTECSILMTLQGVRCYSIVGTERQLIASGPVQLLKTLDGSDLHFLRLDEFEFPLTKEVPCLRVSKGYYMLPMPGNVFYGFVFPSDIPDAYLDVFEKHLSDTCNFRISQSQTSQAQPETVPPQSSSQELVVRQPSNNALAVASMPTVSPKVTTIANGIEQGGRYLASGIQMTGEYLASGIQSTGEYLKTKIVPNEEPSKVHPGISTTLKYASYVSPYCVKVSKGLVNGLVTIAKEVGKASAQSIAETEIWKRSTSGSQSFISPSKMQAAKEIGKASLSAFVNVWDSLDTSGRILLDSTKRTTVDVVTHKYGPEAGEAVNHGLKVGVDVIETGYTLKNMGLKKFSKTALLTTGSELLEDENLQPPPLPPKPEVLTLPPNSPKYLEDNKS
jgi:hypothetical protein